MSAIARSSGLLRLSRRFPLFRRFGKAQRTPRIDVNALPDSLLRDLGFLDGRVAPPRDRLPG